MIKKTKVVVLFGGKSAEHEVSIASAKNIISALDKTKYEIIPLYISKSGQWPANSRFIFDKLLTKKRQNLVVFPVLHGPYGEDGTIQGLLKLAGVPFVGASVLGSAVGMDKDVMKRLLNEAKLPIVKFLCFHHGEKISYETVAHKLGETVFVKPANLGSSVGIHKVKTKAEFDQAVNDAFKYDHKIIIEEFIQGAEIECAVLGNENPVASLPGKVIPNHEFYSYEAKYLDENGAAFEIPAKLSEDKIGEIKELSIRAYKTLCCEGMARVDFFLTPAGKIIISEINTIPGGSGGGFVRPGRINS